MYAVLSSKSIIFTTSMQLEVGTGVKNASSFVDLQITKMPFNVPLQTSHSTITTEISYLDDTPEVKVCI